MNRFDVQLGYYGLSTYDYVVNRRVNRTVDQTLSQFNQLQTNNHNSSKTSTKSVTQQVENRFSLSTNEMFISFLFQRRRSNQIFAQKEDDTSNRSKPVDRSDIFTVEGDYVSED